jgi:small-conductance mechanosensitive channel
MGCSDGPDALPLTVDIAQESQEVMMLQEVFLENGMRDLTLAIGIATAVLVIVICLKWLVIQRLSKLAAKTDTEFDDSLVEMVGRTRIWLLAFPAIYLGSNSLELSDKAVTVLQAAATLALLLQVGLWTIGLMDAWFKRSQEKSLETDAAAATSLAVMRFIGKLVVWTVIFLMVLDNLGVDITALIAGLGVGGIAVALAVQNILGDLFASLSIVVDKPFVIGDFIVVDDYMGTVEAIGLKTTRIRSLGGEQIVFSNNDLLKTRVRNYKRMRERRILFGFGVLYQTTPEQLEAIPATVKRIIERLELARFDRAHFKSFGESSYDFEVVYWMLQPDYNSYMDTQQAINLELVKAFAKDGIDFAYPTRTLFVEGPVTLESRAAREDND